MSKSQEKNARTSQKQGRKKNLKIKKPKKIFIQEKFFFLLSKILDLPLTRDFYTSLSYFDLFFNFFRLFLHINK
ncbi:hypothetical protein BpHYR1_015567 [Brachionus plicatilis]|uniref:Uncharacterized protein n=1 Tax=Brachionus plicatilis TaxID=10195 RepID=A0A3M7S5E8_BRAPC|nr:hypothetical protein BpHYR1_015567 [Brachionus plicatilis]